ncbi:MAG TPA: phage portal protein, partial [Tepidisphaeraceae bacterium]
SQGRLIPAEDVLHMPGLSFDGRLGQSVVWLARQTLGLALATQKYGAKYFANFARPGGLLEAPMLTPEQREQAKQSWQEAQGGENSHRVAVMPPGFKFTPISNKPNESQMIETQRELRLSICAIFHVPPRMVGDDQVKGRASAEQDAQEFIQYALNSPISALKLEWKRKLFPSRGVGRTPKNRFYMDFDLTDMLRPDAASREKYYGTGRMWGFLNTNDVRGFEKQNPIEEPWAEQYWMPVNMTLTTTPINPSYQDGAGNGDAAGDVKDPKAAKDSKRGAVAGEEDDARPVHLYRRLFQDAFHRVCNRQKRDLNAITGAFTPILMTLRDGYFARAAQELGIQFLPGTESDSFLTEYLGAMQHRATQWNDADKEIAEAELQRACKAFRVAGYREAASMKANEGDKHEAESIATGD